MKVLAKSVAVFAVVSFLAGCASDTVYVPKIPPEAQAKLLDYFEQPDNKVFIIAVDPGGDFAYAYDYGKPTLKEAARVAVQKCDASRESSGVVARPYIYALNNKVVYEDMIRQAQREDKVEKDQGAQMDEMDEMAAEEPADVAEEM